MAHNSGKTKKTKVPVARKRLRVGLGIMLTLLLVVGGKLFMVQGLDMGGMAEAALASRLTPQVLPAERGKIVDANGTVLASSVIRYNIVVDQVLNTATSDFKRYNQDTETVETITRDQGISELATLLGSDVAKVRDSLTGDKKYAVVAKDIKPELEDRITKLRIPGVSAEGVSKRVYPNGSVAGGVVGFLQDGTTGQAGIEQTQDEILRGTEGKRVFEIGADGLRIPVATDELTPAVDGSDVKLTLNTDIQYFAQQAIQSQVNKLNAEWGVIVVMDAKTGNLIALADTNAPDPNDPGKVDAKDRGVRAVTAAYEPGSVEKMITAAAVIEEGKSSPLDHFTIPSSYTIDGQTFTDAFEHGTEERTLAGILGWSMNTGTVMAGSRLSKEQRYDWLRKFGIGEKTEVGLPAEATGILAKPEQWDDRQQYTVLFGQGVSQSTLQTVRAYQSIANDGVMLQPRLIDSYIDPDGVEQKVPAKDPRQVVSKETAQQVRDILESAVTEGQIKDAAIDGYRVGAKTGTSQAPREDGLPGFDGYTASMVGMAPMDDPRFIVEVVLQRPKGSIYGITNGPVFRSVMSQVLRTYNVPPSTGTPARLPQFVK
ncbi:penicillin-binding protein 2 [Paenarthrobacter ureafaciens]|uniref:peptidoglycan D,D-transpeptidase FtsI family protein n=1 Tax=Paenarthrobacter TaxID=1742992 RepID=UPI00074D2A41|nr:MULTISPECIES: penicillin-binding protein 2 [Paenarthrobacter]AMB40069.1 peptidoglycan glycosyltransferase [Arthrobacter sp. ATCC 21022]KUR63290.1 peptidoglycan glycosyltransferase [Arthrobacter sp. ATCC 21022]MCW3767164.1 penicillin-binding protein 2 [Paenarthrobacter sp. PAE-2]MCX8454638.1 penicillin-binding protein 2 [Paenarthrobacter ureafaciens]MCY0974131.1 penicillin-binding protein 2 [Paenarthrobacter ureafaciens]